MPLSPEILNAYRTVRIIEVFLKVKAEHFAKTDCHIGITRKIVIDLEKICQSTEPSRYNGKIIVTCIENNVRCLSHCVCNENFLCKSADKTAHTICNLFGSLLSVNNLFADVPVFNNRTCNKLWEKCYVKKNIEVIFLCINRFAVNINYIGQSLKCKE